MLLVSRKDIRVLPLGGPRTCARQRQSLQRGARSRHGTAERGGGNEAQLCGTFEITSFSCIGQSIALCTPSSRSRSPCAEVDEEVHHPGVRCAHLRSFLVPPTSAHSGRARCSHEARRGHQTRVLLHDQPRLRVAQPCRHAVRGYKQLCQALCWTRKGSRAVCSAAPRVSPHRCQVQQATASAGGGGGGGGKKVGEGQGCRSGLQGESQSSPSLSKATR
ncbi:impB/mucB/samB family [Leishmania donovani]|uniref:ImpB/mucB/samB_family_putative/Pfam:PF00817 n=1 Tax=Leishmania donovani TaxID=5661 RepID=A0A6J8FJU3_LEIDO|nr:impB/mucB/samB family [Leishmania donovani]VDZ46152.1 impB/mucB/samB_family_putative/Pfam:PF00817 [Leishmania donovani]